MLQTPARQEEVRAILEEVDDDIVERVVETGASVDELAEALHLVQNNIAGTEVPASARVVEVLDILREAEARDRDRALPRV
jgi:hypothetical protein